LTNITWHGGHLSRDERWTSLGRPGCTVWMTGLSGSGKSTIAMAAEAELVRAGRPAYVLDGDNLRHGLNAGLGFSEADRDENVRRVGEVARLLADSGVVCLVSLVSPFRAGRDRARGIHQADGIGFFEVFVDTPLEECRRRDPKGLYAKAEAGELKGLTGVDSPYEAPERPELRIATATISLDQAVSSVLALIPG
jgi:adenylyl-sulfate kinase